MIKLFASDLDGTLLNAFHQVDKTILRAIREVTAAGVHFAVATGRTMRSPGEFGFAPVDVEVVCASGALVMNREGEIIRHGTVDPVILEEMLRLFPQVSFECVGLTRSYFNLSYEEHQRSFSNDSPLRRIVMAGMRGGEYWRGDANRYSQPLSEIMSHEVCKVNARVLDEGIKRELAAFLADHADRVVNAPFDPVMFEITDAGVNKGEAVSWLAAYLGLTDDEVAVYGDGGNDIVMLERFEHAYATSNGSEDAKEAAGNVIGNCVFHAVPRHMVRTVRAQQSAPRYIQIG